MSARNWTLGLAIGAVLASGAPVALAAGPGGGPGGTAGRTAARAAAPLPGGLGPCVGALCPNPFPQIGTGAPVGRDEAVSIFVGGDFDVRERAAEAEGKVVVIGSFDQDKSAAAGQAYNIGVVGAGSLVPPPNGSDFLTTGKNVNIAAGERLISDGGVVRHAGTAPGAGRVTGPLAKDAGAVAPYTELRDQLDFASKCYASNEAGGERTPTGTARNVAGTVLFTGDNTSKLQVFNVDFDLVNGTNRGAVGLRFANIPADATVLVNMLGTSRTINTFSGNIVDGTDSFNALRTRLLWNFPDATTVDLRGSGQFQGSVLVGTRTSRTTVTLPGMNGRFFTTGSLTHTSLEGLGGGQEFHSYPFNGDLPGCGTPVVTGKVSVLKQDAEGKALAGAKFELWEETNGTNGLQSAGPGADTKVTGSDCTTTTTGPCEQTVGVGTFYWRETAAPHGYELPANPVGKVVLTKENATAGVRVTAVNTRTPVPPATAKVVLWKTDKSTGVALPGARFELWKETNGRPRLQTAASGGTAADTKLPGDCVTDAQGSCTVELPIGASYYWRETGTPEGYERPAQPVTEFELDEDDVAQGVVLNVPNQKKPGFEGAIKVLKLDAKTNRPLRGAVFEVWKETNNTKGLQRRGINADEKVKDGCATDRQGVCTFTPLSEGYYYLVETAVPEGYKLPLDGVTGPLHLDERTPGKLYVQRLTNERDDQGKGKGGREPRSPRG
ncbi:choice-of-anchor A family protein [Streptomyces sp. G-G2]|uniref:choice-of-anchor A family protein n=1 Tax=Streptomyces sp. G-G2 TaxID=3046201 RepID=UPI0024BA5541|nr:choice-of-anchor A family protein [Streptomyces sp. G-G2]MDJ0379449.1 choice-of-anchor A family protein [Streptomyces sp. G-G2]